MSTPHEIMTQIGMHARQASRKMAQASLAARNQVLCRLAQRLRNATQILVAANEKDLTNAKDLAPAFVNRLRMGQAELEQMARGVEQIAALADPIGAIENMRTQPSGICVGKMRVPLGVIAMIYESRPNVTIDAAALAIKSGNAIILRGGSEAIHSNQALTQLIQDTLEWAGLPRHAVISLPSADHALVDELIRAREYVDVLIPRGGKGLIRHLDEHATVPMIKHLDGICHTYVDYPCDLSMAISVTDNAKTQRYSPCNATETLLVHQKVARDFIPAIARIFHDKNVEMRCDGLSRRLVEETGFSALDATDEDWSTEYNAPIISIKIVRSLDEAIDFINHYGSHHTDAIITSDYQHADQFVREVDSSSVMVNASTRFADGFEYGLGAEIGISTDKLHARGPVGLEGLTTTKYVVLGHGEGRQ